MNKTVICTIAVALLWSPMLLAEEKDTTVYPVAILPFEEKGASVKEFGPQVSNLLFAELVANPNVMLVDREELAKSLAEQSLSVTGAVKPDEAVKVGQLTGAKLLVTGIVMEVDKKVYVVAKIMSTETTRVAGASANGKMSDELAPVVSNLAGEISKVISEKGPTLVPKLEAPKDRIALLQKQLGNAARPSVRVEIAERHVGLATIDPAAETEVALLCKSLGFNVVDKEEATKGAADILITGEGMSETVGRIGGLVSVRARVEIKAVDRKSGKVLAIDRQTSRVVDATEQIAGKQALQEAAAEIAERLLPQLVTQEEK